MVRRDGEANGRQIVPAAWIADLRHNGDPAAWARGSMSGLFPNGRYRSKWYASGNASGAFCGIGIHGQWLYVDPRAEVVIAKLSCQPLPVDDPLDRCWSRASRRSRPPSEAQDRFAVAPPPAKMM